MHPVPFNRMPKTLDRLLAYSAIILKLVKLAQNGTETLSKKSGGGKPHCCIPSACYTADGSQLGRAEVSNHSGANRSDSEESSIVHAKSEHESWYHTDQPM